MSVKVNRNEGMETKAGFVPQVESGDLPEEAGRGREPMASRLHTETQSGEKETSCVSVVKVKLLH